MRLDGDGVLLWERALGESGRGRFFSACRMPSGDIVVAGFLVDRGWLVRFSPDGDLRWQKVLGASPSSLAGVVCSPDGTFVAGGSAGYNRWLGRFSPEGSLLRQVRYDDGGFDGLLSLAGTGDGGYVAAVWAEPAGQGVMKVNADLEIPGCREMSEGRLGVSAASTTLRTPVSQAASQSVWTDDPRTATAVVPYEWTSCSFFPVFVTLKTTGSGSGTLSCSPNPANRGSSTWCSATPDVGSDFVQASTTCSGGIIGNRYFQVGPLTADCEVTAQFDLNRYHINVLVNNPAWGSARCEPNPAPHGSQVTCTAFPAANCRLLDMSGCGGELHGHQLTFQATSSCPLFVTFSAPEPIPALGGGALAALALLVLVLGAVALARR